MKRQSFKPLSRIEQAERRYLEADDPWSKEEYRVIYEGMLRWHRMPDVEKLIHTALFILERQAGVYKPQSTSSKSKEVNGFLHGDPLY